MRKLLAGGLIAGLLIGSLGMTAGAAKRKPKPKPKPAKLYLHGNNDIGEIENAEYQLGILTGNVGFMAMDGKAPKGSSAKSIGITNYGAGPNTNCAGNQLFPVWVGRAKGTVKGPMKLTFPTMSSPGEVDVRVFADVLGSACNADYVPAVREVRVPLETDGTVKAILKGKNFKVKQVLMLQVSPADMYVEDARVIPPFVGRMFYDSKDSKSVLSFKCIPASRKAKSCVK